MTTSRSKHAPIQIILETDLFSDVDDVGAMVVAIDHARRGDVEILSVGINTPSQWGPTAAQAILETYGQCVPVGSFRHTDDSVFEPDYARATAEGWAREVPPSAQPAVAVHRRALAQAADASVTVVSIGYFGNLNDLFDSEPDEISSLGGADLIAAKVQRTVVMAGWFPTGREFNLFSEVSESHRFLTRWPTSIDFIGFEVGAAVITGSKLKPGAFPSPLVDAYERYCGVAQGRSSWDLIAVHAAAQPSTDALTWSPNGRIILAPDGSNDWVSAADGTHRYAILRHSVDQMAELLDAQLERF